MSAGAERVDTLAVIGALEYLADRHLSRKRRKFDQAIAAGKEPHPELVTTTERAEYLRDQARAALAAVRGMVADVKQARAALSQNASYPADVALARAALDDAVARVEPQL